MFSFPLWYGVLYISLCLCSQSLGPGGAEGGERRGGCADVHTDGVVISVDHFRKALDQLRSSHSDAIGAPKVSHTSQRSTVYATVELADSFSELGGCWRTRGGKERDT